MVEEYAKRATEINQKYLCVTDHGMMAAVPTQIKECELNNIEPLFGCELYCNPLQRRFTDDKDKAQYVASLSDEDKKAFQLGNHLLAIAYNETGYRNLVKLTSWGWLYGKHRNKPRVNHEQLKLHKEGIIFTTCCYNSEVGRAFDMYGEEAAEQKLLELRAIFGENYYLEIMMLDFHKQPAYDKFIIKMHDKHNMPIILSQDCLTEGTVIYTNKGSKNIEDVIVGDVVLTDKGRYRKVEYVNKRHLNKGEKVYRVKSSIGSFAWDVTGNHEVLTAVVKNKSCKIQQKEVKSYVWKKVEDLTTKDYIVIPKIEKSLVFSKKPLLYIDIKKYLKKEYYTPVEKVGLNFSSNLVLAGNTFKSFRGFDKRASINIPRFLPITDDLLKIIGLYMAEGYCEKKGTLIGFGLHKREKKELNLVKRYFSQFGIICNVRKSGNGVTIRFSSKLFNIFFAKLCGVGSTNKHFPKINGSKFQNFSESQVRQIIAQYWKGDGCIREDKKGRFIVSMATVSKSLAYDLSICLNAFGFCCIPYIEKASVKMHKNPNANSQNWSTSYRISLSGNRSIKLYNFLFDKDKTYEVIEKNSKPFIEDEKNYVIKIKNISAINYEKLVYNLQVEEDETYTANGYIVHNCHYCLKEHSHNQRLMLMVQTGRTIQEIQAAMAEGETKDFFELQDANLWMKSEDELNQMWTNKYQGIIDYDIFKLAKSTTVEICEKAKGVKLDRSNKLPNFPDGDERLKELVFQGFKKRNLPMNSTYMDRLKREYDLICKKGFSGYFLIQKMMVDEARRVCPSMLGFGNGSEAVGCGRGSCVGSLVCFCLGITNVDPLKHGLIFERFLSEARGGKSMKVRFLSKPLEAMANQDYLEDSNIERKI